MTGDGQKLLKENRLAKLVFGEYGTGNSSSGKERDRVKKSHTAISSSQNYTAEICEEKIEDDKPHVDKCAGKFRTVFTAEQEQELVEYINLMESILLGLTLNDCHAVAYQLDERNHIEHPFNKIKQLAGMYCCC
ncbi:uncharacterized protein [Anabrus simplex]|uniref:uncharacterized protein n=1 Tax=Anabrus simplex TaxID=316456 RepID=UPI0035A2E06E